jgi:hypothetical protein
LRGRDSLLNGRAGLVGRPARDSLDILLQTELGRLAEMLNFSTSPNLSKRERRKRRPEAESRALSSAEGSPIVLSSVDPPSLLQYEVLLPSSNDDPSSSFLETCKMALMLCRLPYGQHCSW